jgi:hypothetical protein
MPQIWSRPFMGGRMGKRGHNVKRQAKPSIKPDVKP